MEIHSRFLPLSHPFIFLPQDLYTYKYVEAFLLSHHADLAPPRAPYVLYLSHDCLGKGGAASKGRVRLSGLGHVGIGGSMGLCDPASGLAFAMTTNKVHPF